MATEDTNPGKNLFEGEPEILEGPSLDEKLDKIIELLEKNEREHQDLRDRLEKIENNQELLQAAYQQHGKMLGELMARMNGLGAHA